jgi:hypothetical protein
VEELAWQLAPAASIDEEIQRQYIARLQGSASKLRVSLPGQLPTAIVGFVAGEVAGALVGVPGVGGVAGGAMSVAVGRSVAALAQPRWLLADQAIRKRAKAG